MYTRFRLLGSPPDSAPHVAGRTQRWLSTCCCHRWKLPEPEQIYTYIYIYIYMHASSSCRRLISTGPRTFKAFDEPLTTTHFKAGSNCRRNLRGQFWHLICPVVHVDARARSKDRLSSAHCPLPALIRQPLHAVQGEWLHGCC